ncbi:hypothetical protein DER44DRAFT_856565 [Fusarium oxysporum]|nr:hypothetical protein DER44DRAFT_856565 [Fusarium oxysporum]
MSGESKASLSSQYRWENILTPAPVALNALGACAVATGSQKANTTFAPLKEGFKYLSDFAGVKLHTNLSKCMSKINMLSETVYGRFENVLETLSDLEGARRLVGREMESRNYASLDCLNSSKEIHGKFRDWINHACELHRACVAAEPTSEDLQVLKDIELAVAGASIDYQQQIFTNQLEKSLEAANEAFQRDSDGFPKDWDIVGRQVVEKLADSLATALNQAMPTPSASKPKDADDPAYSQVMRDLIYWELLSTAFVGTTDGIAWDRAGQAATFAAKMLAHSQKSFGALASGSESSQQYKSALDSVCRIANGIMTEVEQFGKSMGYTAPSKDSEAVKSWQRDFLSNYATYRFKPRPPKTRLHAASEALAATRETYQNSTGILVEQQERLNHVNAKMESLKNSAPEMNAIMGILVQAIATMLKIKTEIVNLVRFFNAISVAVRFVMKKYVNPYVDTIKAGNDGDKIGPTTIIRSYFSTFADYASMWVRMSPMSIFPMLSMVEELSSFSGMGMDPRMISRKANETQEFSRRAIDEISRKAKDARSNMKFLRPSMKLTFLQGQSKTIRNMETRVSETNEKKQTLPSVSPEIATAISSGVENSKRAAQQGIRTEADQNLLVKPLPRGSEF